MIVRGGKLTRIKRWFGTREEVDAAVTAGRRDGGGGVAAQWPRWIGAGDGGGGGRWGTGQVVHQTSVMRRLGAERGRRIEIESDEVDTHHAAAQQRLHLGATWMHAGGRSGCRGRNPTAVEEVTNLLLPLLKLVNFFRERLKARRG